MKLKSKTNLIKIFLVSLIWIFFSFIYTQQANAATYSFNPTSQKFDSECTSSINVQIDATGQSSNAADIEIGFNSSEIEILEVKTGEAYDTYFANGVDVNNNNIRIAAGSFLSNLQSNKVFATIYFRSKPGTTSTSFDIKFDGVGETLDSNIADASTSTDLLTGVTNGTYTFESPPYGSCTQDNQPPIVHFLYPTHGQTKIPANSNMEFSITDNLSGVDLNSLLFELNGEGYIIANPEVTNSGSSLNYSFEIDPRSNNQIIGDNTNVLKVSGRDMVGNNFSTQIAFNIPDGEAPPVIPTPIVTPVDCVCDDIVVCENKTTNVVPPHTSVGNVGDEKYNCPEFPNSEPTDQPVQVIEIVEPINQYITNLGILDSLPFTKNLPSEVQSNVGTSAFVVSALALGLLPYIALLNTPGAILNLVGFIAGKKQRRPWGVVLDNSTRKPIQFAVCSIFTPGTKNKIDQTLTDGEGRYTFSLPQGSYRLEVTKNGYDIFEQKITVSENGAINVTEIYLINKALKAKLTQNTFSFKEVGARLLHFYQRALPFIFTLGFLVSIASLLIAQNLINLIVFGFYLLFLILIIASKYNFKSKYSTIIDSQSVLRLPNALVKIFDPQTGQLIDTKLTNNNGYFDYWGNDGTFWLHVSIRGYAFPSEVQTDIKKIYFNEMPMLEVPLRTGQNKLRILVDPTS